MEIQKLRVLQTVRRTIITENVLLLYYHDNDDDGIDCCWWWRRWRGIAERAKYAVATP